MLIVAEGKKEIIKLVEETIRNMNVNINTSSNGSYVLFQTLDDRYYQLTKHIVREEETKSLEEFFTTWEDLRLVEKSVVKRNVKKKIKIT